MAEEIWQLDANRARLSLDRLMAEVDLSSPGLGLQHLRLHVLSLQNARLLAVALGIGSSSPDEESVEHYIRREDLIASYPQTAARRYRTQIYWRGLLSRTGDIPAALCGIELVVSVTTSHLDAHPQLATVSRLSASEIMQLTDPANGAFDVLTSRVSADSWREPSGGAGCLLMRLEDSPYSYLEMVHPLDAVQASLNVGTANEVYQIRRQLIHRRMEKGVIVRARVQGWFVDKSADIHGSIALYRRFAASSLPLTT